MLKYPQSISNRTISNHSHYPSIRSSLTQKSPYAPYNGCTFEQLIFDRLQSQNRVTSKSIFLLRGSPNLNDNELNRSKYNFPKLSISTTLDRQQKKYQTKMQTMQNQNSLIIKSDKKYQISVVKKPKKKISVDSKPYINRPLFNITSKFPAKQKGKMDIKLNDMVLGNKTRLNFRKQQNHQPNINKMNRTKHSNHIVKVKMGTFYNRIQQFAPWGVNQRLQQFIS